ncbi:DNA ligase, partial [Candidatus Bathyarchaeota archaeon]|nr:DNA ligase [Candidatus Bathyarchaeota archaeon]
METAFKELAELCESLEATSKRNIMVSMVSDFLRKLHPEEVEPAVSMILGRAFPKWDQRTLEVSWTTIANIIKRLTNVDWKIFIEAFRQTGDVGDATKIVFEKSKVKRQATLLERPLTILEVRRIFEAMAQAYGAGSREKRERLVETLLGKASPIEAKYLVKIMIGEMRTGFHEGLMELAVSKAFGIPENVVQRAVMMRGDIGEVAYIAKTGGKEELSRLGFRIFHPVKPMLAQTAENIEEAIKEHGGKTAFEYKLDGARIQIHKRGDEVRIFSRRLTDVTASLPEIVELIRREINAKEVIMEGEVIAVGEDGSPL